MTIQAQLSRLAPLLNALVDILSRIWWLPIVLVYVAYLSFIAVNNQSGVDYETFLDIGKRWLAGRDIYVENSYYPMPTVMIFGLLAWLPDWFSIVVWHGTPVLLALYITRTPLVLLFAPLFAHFLGGQTAIFGLIGLYGYRRWSNQPKGDAWLAVTLFKPQLGIIPIVYAMTRWRDQPKQALAFLMTALALYGPSFLIDPTWLMDWLGNDRGLRWRAMAAIIPRTVLILTGGWLFWIAVVILGGGLLGWLWQRGRLDLDTAVVWGFVALPLLHDYDLVAVIPVLEGKLLRVAVVLSIPVWCVIFVAYSVDMAWYAVTLIGAGVMVWMVRNDRTE